MTLLGQNPIQPNSNFKKIILFAIIPNNMSFVFQSNNSLQGFYLTQSFPEFHFYNFWIKIMAAYLLSVVKLGNIFFWKIEIFAHILCESVQSCKGVVEWVSAGFMVLEGFWGLSQFL